MQENVDAARDCPPREEENRLGWAQAGYVVKELEELAVVPAHQWGSGRGERASTSEVWGIDFAAGRHTAASSRVPTRQAWMNKGTGEPRIPNHPKKNQKPGNLGPQNIDPHLQCVVTCGKSSRTWSMSEPTDVAGRGKGR